MKARITRDLETYAMVLFNSVLLILVKGEKILRMFRSYVLTPEDAVEKLNQTNTTLCLWVEAVWSRARHKNFLSLPLTLHSP